MTPIYKDDPITDEDIEDDEEYRLRPGEVIGFLLQQDCEFNEGPYPTEQENEVFFEAQRGGYDRDGFGLEEMYDDHDTRDLRRAGHLACTAVCRRQPHHGRRQHA